MNEKKTIYVYKVTGIVSKGRILAAKFQNSKAFAVNSISFLMRNKKKKIV
jgi:hypothetical protein